MGNVFGVFRKKQQNQQKQPNLTEGRGFHLRLHSKPEKQHPMQPISQEENDAINALVDQFLANELVNNRFIPDAVERKMYCNVVKMIVGILKVSIDHASLEVFGHRFVVSMTPVVNAPPPPRE
jgi:hypothetical protein